MTYSSIGGTCDLPVSPFGGSHLLMGRWRTSNVSAQLRIQGDDQSGCLSVSSSSARPNAGRYRPKFNSKSLGTP